MQLLSQPGQLVSTPPPVTDKLMIREPRRHQYLPSSSLRKRCLVLEHCSPEYRKFSTCPLARLPSLPFPNSGGLTSTLANLQEQADGRLIPVTKEAKWRCRRARARSVNAMKESPASCHFISSCFCVTAPFATPTIKKNAVKGAWHIIVAAGETGTVVDLAAEAGNYAKLTQVAACRFLHLLC